MESSEMEIRVAESNGLTPKSYRLQVLCLSSSSLCKYFLPILFGRASGVPSKHPIKMRVIRESALVGYALGRDVTGGQEQLGFTDTRGAHVGVRGGPQGLPKDADEVILTEMKSRGQFLQRGRTLQILGQAARHMIHQHIPLAADWLYF